MGLLYIFQVIFIWPVILLLRGIGRPFIAIGQLLLWLLYHRRRRNSIGGGTTPAYGDQQQHASSSNADGDNIILPGQTGGCFNNGDNLKFRNRQGLKNEAIRGGGPGGPLSVDPNLLNAASSGFPNKPLPAFYYAINVPPSTLDGAESPQLVFQEKLTVLKEIKKYKGARFKAFPTEQEAIEFANYVPEVVTTPVKSAFQNEDTAGNSPHPAFSEKSNWKAPKGHELLKLRKSIEAGDYEAVQDMISSNPRFLISCGDTPSILHEGPRYNALHFAAKNNRPEIIKLWFQTIEDPSFFVKLYGQSQENELARNIRVQKLLDLYLNTPDKGPCETPLHFACKFGHKEVVEVLMSHPLTETNPRNKFGETPADLICQRVDKPSKQVIEQIKQYLEGRRYVPLYRAEDNMISPTVGTPCSPIFRADIFSPPFAVPQPFSPETISASPKSPHDPQAVVKAFAGPMSPSQADQFRKLWRSPCSRNEQSKVVREDHEKGYERLGRDLAQQNNVSWSEYWEFLDRFTDLSKPEGIELLESHLQKQSLALNVQSSLETIQQQSANNFPVNSPQLSLSATNNRLYSMKKTLNFGESSQDSPLLPSPTTTSPSLKPSTDQLEEMDVGKPLENGTTMPCNQPASHPEKELSFREENLEEIMNTLAQDFGTKLCIMSPENSFDNGPTEMPDIEVTQDTNMNCLFSLKDDFTDMLSAAQDQEPLTVTFLTVASCDKPTSPCLSPASPKSSITAGTVMLNITSPKKLIAQINGMPAKSPPKLRKPLKVFIQGSVPTKLDRDVLRCVKKAPVDPEQFPYTSKWLQLIDSFSEIEQKIWPSPAKAYGKEVRFKDVTPKRAIGRLEPLVLFQ